MIDEEEVEINYNSNCLNIEDTLITGRIGIRKVQLNPPNTLLDKVVVELQTAIITCEMSEFSISTEYSYQYNDQCEDDCSRRNVVFSNATIKLCKCIAL